MCESKNRLSYDVGEVDGICGDERPFIHVAKMKSRAVRRLGHASLMINSLANVT